MLAILAAGFLALGATEAWRDSPTFDEPIYVVSGLAAILHQDLALNDEHPPLVKVLAALPVLLVRHVVPANGSWSGNDEQPYSSMFVNAQLRAGTLRAVDFASRIVPLLIAAGTAFLVFGFANELYGGNAGLLGGVLWLASPLVLGLGHLDGVDLPFACAVTWFGWALLRWSRTRSRRRLVVLGIAGALCALTEASGLLMIAIGGGVVIALDWRGARVRATLRAVAVAAIGLLGVWLVYVVLDPAVITHPAFLLPRPYLDGIDYLRAHDTIPADAYLDGMSWVGGRWWYWPVSLAIKLPPATLAVLILGPLGLLGVDRVRRRDASITAVLPAAVLFAFTLTLPRDIGVRYLMPVIALWLVVAGGAAATQRSRVLRGALLTAGGLGIWSTTASVPNSIAWTSPAFAAPYRVASNSNVDWGQDLFLLQGWNRTHQARVAYFGPRGVTLADIPAARPLLGVPLDQVTGWVAVSATDLTTGASLAWLRGYCPVASLGDTILLYRFTRPPTPTPGPAEPAAPCRQPTSSRVR